MSVNNREEFSDVLALIMDRLGPDGQRTKTPSALAKALGVDNSIVSHWRSGQRKPNEQQFSEILAQIFGSNNQSRDARLLRAAFNRTRAGKDIYAFYAEKSTVVCVWEHLFREGGLPKREDDFLEATTVDELSWVIRQLDSGIEETDANSLANSARAFANDVKYGRQLTEERDERHISGIENWNDEFSDLLSRLNVAPKKNDLLAVGIGPGLEGVGIYDRFRTFVGLDVSHDAVERAEKVFPTRSGVSIREGKAEKLPEQAKRKTLYVCLKTYMSSYFDIRQAVFQASDALEKGGIAIISIPRGYGVGTDSVYGIARTNYNYPAIHREGGITYHLPDKGYVYELIHKICTCLGRALFSDIQIHSGAVEHYIVAQKVG